MNNVAFKTIRPANRAVRATLRTKLLQGAITMREYETLCKVARKCELEGSTPKLTQVSSKAIKYKRLLNCLEIIAIDAISLANKSTVFCASKSEAFQDLNRVRALQTTQQVAL